MNDSYQFIGMLNSLWNQPVPNDVINRAKKSLLDYLAVTCAGAEFQKEKIKKFMSFSQPESGSFRVIGLGKDLSLKDTVFLNGLNSHALDYDDGTNSGIIHLGAPIFSLLIPLAQRYNISVDDMLRAVIMGYEASYTMAISIQPIHKLLGFHATGTCGTLGAAIAASYMLDFSEEERFHSFSAACVAASGMLKVLDDGSELKPYNVAKTSLLALTSLELAKAGFKGHIDPLGGRGFFKMMTGKDDIVLKPVLLNDSYAIMKTYTKPYASCRYTHPAVEAAIHLCGKININEIEEISIKTYDLAVIGHNHTQITGSYSAKMSIPYATAVGLIFGKAGLQEFSDKMVRDPQILDLVKKIKVYSDDEISRSFPEKQSAIVSVKTNNEEYTERVDYPKGEPENPLTDIEFRERYDGLMGYAGILPDVSDTIFNEVYIEDTKVNSLVKKL